MIAGINAGLAALRRPSLVLTRADGFIGVMIDDLIVKGAEEPCDFCRSPIQPSIADTSAQIACSRPGQSTA